MKTGIIFDMDGTLWDSTENIAMSWDVVVQREKPGLRRITTKDIQGVVGHTMKELEQMLFPMLEEKEAGELLELCCVEENRYLSEHGGILYPQMEDTLKILSERYPLYIVSNCQKGYIEAFLDYYQFWNYFEDMECFGNNNMGKEHNIALVVKRNCLDQAVYVGDIQGDYDSSMEAGVEFIHAAYGFGKIDRPVPCIHSCAELPQAAAEVFAKKAKGK